MIQNGQKRYLAARPLSLRGVQVLVGQPVPEDAYTPALIAVGWLEAVSPTAWAAACKRHGTPPTGELAYCWSYRRAAKKPPKRKKARV